MVTKFGGQILATKFGFVADCLWVNFETHWSLAGVAMILNMQFSNISTIDILNILSVTTFRWMLQDLMKDASILIQVMAWCLMAIT